MQFDVYNTLFSYIQIKDYLNTGNNLQTIKKLKLIKHDELK